MDPRVGLCVDVGHTARTGVDVVDISSGQYGSSTAERPEHKSHDGNDDSDKRHTKRQRMPTRTSRRSGAFEVLRGLGQYHPAVGTSIEMGHEAIAFVTGLATFEKTRQLGIAQAIGGQAIVGTRHRGDLQFLNSSFVIP